MTRRRRVLKVELTGPGSLVSGYGSRDLVEEITGRAPMWVRSRRGWSVQEHTARDFIAKAEMLGYDLIIEGPRMAEQKKATPTEETLEHPALAEAEVAESGLW